MIPPQHSPFALAAIMQRLPWLVLAGLAPFATAASADITPEHQTKSAAILNLIAFTEWPDAAFATPETPLTIGVLGDGTVAGLLNDLAASEKWRGRRMILQRVSIPAEARGCHVLYIARSEHSRWRAISSEFSGRPILTISDAENFAPQGGMVQLSMDQDKLRMIVNLGITRASGLVISSKLLRLMEVIEDRQP